MATLSIAIAFGVRLCLVLLFLPFSALDKVIDFRSAVAQARQAASSTFLATALVAGGFCTEVVMSTSVLTGVADRAAACVLAGYCGITALLWKQFWKPGDFWAAGQSRARDLLWDFWKNIALVGGFLLVTFGTGAGSVKYFLSDPLASTHPYQVTNNSERPL